MVPSPDNESRLHYSETEPRRWGLYEGLEEAAVRLERLLTEHRPVVAAVGGASASGKTTVAVPYLTERFPSEVRVLATDRYYRPETEHWHQPDALDWQRLSTDLAELRHSSRGMGRLIVVEGMFALADPIGPAADLRIFMEASPATQLERRVRRNTARGVPEREVIRHTRSVVWPAYRAHLLPLRQRADVIIVSDQES